MSVRKKDTKWCRVLHGFKGANWRENAKRGETNTDYETKFGWGGTGYLDDTIGNRKTEKDTVINIDVINTPNVPFPLVSFRNTPTYTFSSFPFASFSILTVGLSSKRSIRSKAHCNALKQSSSLLTWFSSFLTLTPLRGSEPWFQNRT